MIKPRPTASAFAASSPYVSVPEIVVSSCSTVRCVRSGCRATCHSSTSINVRALVAAGTDGRVGAGGPRPTRSCVGEARSNACARSWTVSASPMICAGSRMRNACSIRRTSSVRPRLSIPRSRSIRLDASTSMNRERCGCSSRTRFATIATISRSREPWFAAESNLSDCPGIKRRIGDSVRRRFAVHQTVAYDCSPSCRDARYSTNNFCVRSPTT